MKCHMTFIVCLIATLSTALTLAQPTSAQTDATVQDSTDRSPVAYVYVSGGTYNTSEIYAYGQLPTGSSHPCQVPLSGLS